jgi:hypothetical protein
MEQPNQSTSPSDDQNGDNQSGDKKTNKPILIIVGIVIIVCLVICFATSLFNNGSTRTTTRDSTEAYDKVILMTVTEDYVKQYLVSPSSAKFPRNQEWSITDNGSTIIVRSYVDAQNSFGAEIRSNFLAKYSLPKVELQYLEIDGEVMYQR